MKIVVAPDKFAGTLTAAEAARAMAEGWRRARPDDEVVLRPMADGGEGTLAVLREARPDVAVHEREVADARGVATTAQWLLLDDGTALVETAQACGIAGLSPAERDPRRLTTYGVGQLLEAAAGAGARRIVVTLGGSATVDGGAGAATALGHRLLRADGNGLKVGGAYLADLDAVRPAPRMPDVEIVLAVDVDNPLLGERGAARVFGPQKGADPDTVEQLEDGLAHFADVVERDLDGGPWRHLEGAGAAGGLGFGLAAFAGGRFAAGAGTVAELVGLDAALQGAAWCITGEGSLDRQTAAGKTPEHVRTAAVAAGARVAVVAGRILDDAGEPYDAHRSLGPEGPERAAELVRDRTAEIAGGVT